MSRAAPKRTRRGRRTENRDGDGQGSTSREVGFILAQRDVKVRYQPS